METFEKKLVVIVDAQNDFEDPNGALYVAGAEKLIPLQNEYIRTLKPWEIGAVVYTFDTHTVEEYKNSEEAKQFKFHCEKGTWGHNLAVENSTIPTSIPVFKLEKTVFSMWEDTNAEITPMDLLTKNQYCKPMPRDDFFELIHYLGIKKVEIIGVASDFCVLWASIGFIQRGFDVSVKRNLVKGIFKEIDQVVTENKLNITVT